MIKPENLTAGKIINGQRWVVKPLWIDGEFNGNPSGIHTVIGTTSKDVIDDWSPN